MLHTRRDFLMGSAAAAAAATTVQGQRTHESHTAATSQAAKKPNIILYLADQMRWDFLQHNRSNPTPLTPNLDKLANGGCNFTSAVTNQPLCGPARSVLMTGRYATETGVWHNGIPLANEQGKLLPTFAAELRKAGYTANLFGKWHLGPDDRLPGGDKGKVALEHRGGFDDTWIGSNLLEITTHPYSGTLWDRDMNPITWKDEYRVDYITDHCVKFLKQKQDKPFFMFISQLEPHQQNDLGKPVAPDGYPQRYTNKYVPPDLRAIPGSWQGDLPDYYGCIASIDESVGRVMKTLEEQGLAENTVFIFMSDHGCHFKTRNAEYKRSPHASSIRVPMIFSGPGFDTSMTLEHLVGIVDLAPTILEIAGVTPPASMKGRSMLPLMRDEHARQTWENVQYIQVSEAMTGRAIRTPEWTYVVEDRNADVRKDAGSLHYTETMLYNQFADPAEQTNLIGNLATQEIANELRELLLRKMEYAGEERAQIMPTGNFLATPSRPGGVPKA